MTDLVIIENKIYEIRGQKVMLDFDLAEMYEIGTKYLKQMVRRNAERFPEDFMFQLSNEEVNCLIEVANCNLKQRRYPLLPLRLHRTRRRHAFRHPPESQSHRSQHQHHACLRPHAAISSLSCSEARAWRTKKTYWIPGRRHHFRQRQLRETIRWSFLCFRKIECCGTSEKLSLGQGRSKRIQKREWIINDYTHEDNR